MPFWGNLCALTIPKPVAAVHQQALLFRNSKVGIQAMHVHLDLNHSLLRTRWRDKTFIPRDLCQVEGEAVLWGKGGGSSMAFKQLHQILGC
jgi:hypothetical protein